MDDYHKVEILLKEYEMLRTDMHQRFRQRFQFVTIFGGLGAFALFATDDLSVTQTVLLVVAALVLLIVWFWIGDLIAGASIRLAVIECEVNSLAGVELLGWETAQVKGGILHRIHRKSFLTRQPPAPDLSKGANDLARTREE